MALKVLADGQEVGLGQVSVGKVVVADVVSAVIAVEEFLSNGSPFAEEALDHVTICEFELLVAGPATEAL